jgi:hypothetical protein
VFAHMGFIECLLILIMDGTFFVNVFKTHIIVRYNYLELEKGKQDNFNEK